MAAFSSGKHQMKISDNKAFTLIEVIVAAALIMILTAFTFSEMQSMRRHLRVSGARREVAFLLGTLRSEAIRLRAPVAVNVTSTGFQWDVFDDGTIEGTFSLPTEVTWKTAGAADSFSFDGLGLVRNGASEVDLSLALSATNQEMHLSVNSNGHIEL